MSEDEEVVPGVAVVRVRCHTCIEDFEGERCPRCGINYYDWLLEEPSDDSCTTCDRLAVIELRLAGTHIGEDPAALIDQYEQDIWWLLCELKGFHERAPQTGGRTANG